MYKNKSQAVISCSAVLGVGFLFVSSYCVSGILSDWRIKEREVIQVAKVTK